MTAAIFTFCGQGPVYTARTNLITTSPDPYRGPNIHGPPNKINFEIRRMERNLVVDSFLFYNNISEIVFNKTIIFLIVSVCDMIFKVVNSINS